MNLGESTSGYVELSNETSVITVPAGETWKFTFISASGASVSGDGYVSNYLVLVGIQKSSSNVDFLLESEDSGDAGVVGFANTNSINQIMVDGDNNDGLVVRENDGNTKTIHWAATRVS